MVMLRASLGFILAAISISAAAATNRLAFDSLPHARFEFTGPVGFRISRVEQEVVARLAGFHSRPAERSRWRKSPGVNTNSS